nr:N-acetylmuramoyl-L-alanine amidase [uncultured Capnocytophaga sp.]
MKLLHYILFGVLYVVSAVGYAQKTPVFKVVLDAGHGGKDPGKVVNKTIYEKDVVLKIALLVGKKLEAYPDIKVIYTRKTDELIDLYERGAIANRNKADVFVSIHCNAHETQVGGAETYVLGLNANEQNFEVAKAENSVIYMEDNYEKKYAKYNINSPESLIGLSIMQEEFLEQSIQLAKIVQNQLTSVMKRSNRGVRQAGFIVLHQTYMPSILIETAFLTNNEERKFLTSAKGQDEFAENIATAILEYKKWVQGKSSYISPNESVSVQSEGDRIHPEKHTTNNHTTKNLSYKIQISSSPKRLEAKSFNFKGLSPISVEKDGSVYVYYYGNALKHREALILLTNAKKKGYKDAYITAFYQGKRITIQKAKQLEK